MFNHQTFHTQMKEKIEAAAELIINSKNAIAFTGAGISAESGIPTYRGIGGVWENINPAILELDFFLTSPEESWVPIREKFYQFFGKVKPNAAHDALTQLQEIGQLNTIITQNIDHLHQDSGSENVYEFHGTLHTLSCVKCGTSYKAAETDMSHLPYCKSCDLENNFLKPDFVFFGEGIPDKTYTGSFEAAQNADLCLIVGTTGLVTPAATIPHIAHQNKAKIIEINLDSSAYTNNITDIFLQGKATSVLSELVEKVKEFL